MKSSRCLCSLSYLRFEKNLLSNRLNLLLRSVFSLFAPFKDKNLITKLQMDPRTRPFLSQPDYLKMVQDLQTNPSNIM